MSDQSNNVSGGYSLLFKTVKPGRAEPMIGGDATNRNLKAFSNDLDQARQQQLDKTRAELSQSGNSKAGRLMSAASSKNTTPSATMVEVSRLHVGGLAQDSLIEKPAVASVASRFIPTDTEESTNALQIKTIQPPIDDANLNAVIAIDSQSKLQVTATSSKKGSGFQASKTQAIQMLQQQSAAAPPFVGDAASDMTAPAPNAGVRYGAIGEIVTQSTLAGRSSQLANGLDEGSLSQESPIEEQSAAGIAGRLMPTEIDESANALPSETIQRPNDEANQNAIVTIGSHGKLPVLATLSENGSGFQASSTEAMQLLQQQSDASTPVVKDAASNMTLPALNAGSLSGTIGEIVTQGTLARHSRQSVNSLENNSGMTNMPGLSGGNSRLSGESANTANAAPEPITSEQAARNTLAQANAMGLVQVTSGNAIVTQATLAGRLRQQDNDVAEANAAEVLQKIGDSGPMQTGTAPLNARDLERLPASDTALSGNSLSGFDSMIEVTDGNKGVQQRLATTEAMLAQMAAEAGNTVVRAPTADNMLLAMSGGSVAAPAVQHTESVAGPIVQAPLNIPLSTSDAETALAGNVKWMTNEGVKSAVMTVTPQGMGPISIKIGIDGNQMEVSIIASQHTTRDALESMLPRLREQLAVQGHESVKVDVSDGKSDQSRSGNGHSFAESRNPAGTTPQDNQSNSSKNGEKSEYGGSEQLEVVSESFMAEDLQRVAARVVGEVDGRPVIDAYV